MGKRRILFVINLFLFVAVIMPMAFGHQQIKEPNVSGQFYSDDPRQLSAHIGHFVQDADVLPYDKHIDIVIVPHAGYVYSGEVAAYGFKAVSRNTYNTIVILAPSHFFGFDGISIWEKGGFQTPLGVAAVDEEFTKKLIAASGKFYFEPRAFEEEHSLEVEIPFLQETFESFKIVPVIMGQPDLKVLEEFAATLNQIIGSRDDVLIVVSTDMSHYHDDATARKMDQRTMAAIEGLNVEQLWKECHLRTMEMCGFVPVTAALIYARQKGLKNVDVLRYANSGDVSGDRDRVVGYTSVLIYNGPSSGQPSREKGNSSKKENGQSTLTLEQKRRLVDIAKDTIRKYIETGEVLEVQENDPRLSEDEGAFVTIHKEGDFRGCIGNVIGSGPLYLTVRDVAISSAVRDPRFSPVQAKELDAIDVEVSVLSKPRVIKNVDEIQMGVHGVIISQGADHQGVFLPQVAASTGWSKEEFLSQLCTQKARLPADAWKNPKTTIKIFTADVFSEHDVR